jgi:protein-tyrosine phosphatase
MAEVILRAQLKGSRGIKIGSAGTHALVGYPMPPEAKAVLAGLGLADEPPHLARQLTVGLARQADLILTATRQHRRQVVEVDATAGPRTFTIREFGYVASHATEAWIGECGRFPSGGEQGKRAVMVRSLRAAVAAASAQRGVVPRAKSAEFDVADPFGGPLEAYAEAIVRTLPALEATVEYLTRVGRHALDEGLALDGASYVYQVAV